MSYSSGWYDAFFHDFKADLSRLGSTHFFVGYSGGLDSRLLLELACQAVGPENVTAIHVNHGISVSADDWAEQCQQVCSALACEVKVCAGEVVPEGGGLEAAAREFRYQQFRELLPENAVLLLAHHLDDQVETFFLRLMRGAGPHGLKAMASLASRDHYRLYRPLLSLSKQQLIDYANELKLTWIDDESNADLSLDRNYLRHQVLPRFEERWPGYRERVQNVIRLLDEPESSANPVSVDEALQHRLSFDDGLKLVQLDDFSDDQILSLLHAWLTAIGQQVPSRDRLQAIYNHVIKARPDATPEVRLGNGAIRRHGPAISWVKDMAEVGAPPLVSDQQLQPWAGVGEVRLVEVSRGTERIRADLPDLHWRTRTEGETVKPIGRSKSRDLKRLLQEYRVKPWLRYRVPILYSGDHLVAVGDLFIAEEFQAAVGETGYRVIWQNNVIPD